MGAEIRREPWGRLSGIETSTTAIGGCAPGPQLRTPTEMVLGRQFSAPGVTSADS